MAENTKPATGWPGRLRRLLPAMVFLVCLAPLAALTHELGHGLTAAAFGCRINYITVGPALQVYPAAKWIKPSGIMGSVDLDAAPAVRWQEGLSKLMGAGSNAVIACLLLVAMLLLPSARAWRFQAAAVVLFGWDIICYGILPQIGLKHGVFIGGDAPEPVVACTMLGLPTVVFNLLLGGYVIAIHALLWCTYVRATRSAKACAA